MSNWSNFYKDRIKNSYVNYVKYRYQPFIDILMSVNCFTFREEGCGVSTISKILKEFGVKNIDMFDFDFDQVVLSQLNLKSDIPHIGNILKKQDEVNCIFSHGVLEHFNDNDIVKILSRQKAESKCVIHYVPTNKYESQSFGDERLLDIEYWKKLVNPSKTITFNNEKDLIMLFK